jgi:Phosphorylase b kinase C-terminal domain
MTPGELKFALHVENILSTVSQPEYRQLLLEALMVLTMLVEYEPKCTFTKPFYIKSLVWKAYQLFLADQVCNSWFNWAHWVKSPGFIFPGGRQRGWNNVLCGGWTRTHSTRHCPVWRRCWDMSAFLR